MDINIKVSDESIAREVGTAIVGRAQKIHENPHDDHEDTAEELRDIGQDLLREYGSLE